MTGRDAQRRLYAPEEMTRLIAPRSVAVVGVSERPNAFGSRTVANMKSFGGRLYQINAKHSALAGRPLLSEHRRASADAGLRGDRDASRVR